MSRLVPLVLSSVRVFSAMLLTGSVAVASARAQTSEPPRVPADVRAAQEFLFAAYPDLAREGVTIHFRPEGSTYLLSVAELRTPAAGEVTAPESQAPVLLRGTIAFDTAGRLAGYSADGPYLNDAANAVLRDTVRNHPKWIQSDADVEVMRLGGASVVGETFAPRANPTAANVGRHIGAGVKAAAPQFALRATAPDGVAPLVKAVWLIAVTASDGASSSVQYQFVYEPIGGRLIGVTKIGGAQ